MMEKNKENKKKDENYDRESNEKRVDVEDMVENVQRDRCNVPMML